VWDKKQGPLSNQQLALLCERRIRRVLCGVMHANLNVSVGDGSFPPSGKFYDFERWQRMTIFYCRFVQRCPPV
jgi:hypothetical protein